MRPAEAPRPRDADDPVLEEIILVVGGLRVTFRLARLVALWWLSTLVLAGCFWVILSPTSPQIDTLCGNLAVSIVTAWITAIAVGTPNQR